MVQKTFRISFDVDYDPDLVPASQLKEKIRSYLFDAPALPKLPVGVTTVKLAWEPAQTVQAKVKVKLK